MNGWLLLTAGVIDSGVGAVAGGVLVVLLYLAVFGGRGKKSQSKDLMKKDDGFADYEEI